MPTIKPISELQRNTASLVREAMETKEPIYLTKNGSASVVLIDAQEYDRQAELQKHLWKEYVKALYQLGEAQKQAGLTSTFDEVLLELQMKWGSDVF